MISCNIPFFVEEAATRETFSTQGYYTHLQFKVRGYLL